MRSVSQKLQTEILFASETLDDWMICQANYLYLENIFKNLEIKSKLPNENTMFETVDKFFVKTMKQLAQNKQVHRIIKPDLHKSFKKHKETLQLINKALENYLELKRKCFPRFYFLSNDDLLDVLANSQDTKVIQKHTKKMFEAVFRLYFKDTDEHGNPLLEDINY